jgi:hypothetical protein
MAGKAAFYGCPPPQTPRCERLRLDSAAGAGYDALTCLSMISAQTRFRICREGKPLHTFR